MTRPADQETLEIIRNNWQQVCSDVADACKQVDRDPTEVTIVGVAKYVDAALTAQLVAAGCTIIGENRPQVLWEKFDWFQQNGISMPRWHMIGHLQRNKVRRTLASVDMIQSVDSVRLAKELSDEAVRQNRAIDFLVDVNLTQDATKTGIGREELCLQASALSELPKLRWCGLMAMSSFDADSATIANEFSEVRKLRDQLQQSLVGKSDLRELSMGMSGDYREAIAQGATLVRIGTRLWNGIL